MFEGGGDEGAQSFKLVRCQLFLFALVAGKQPEMGGAQFGSFFNDPVEKRGACQGLRQDDRGCRRWLMNSLCDFEEGGGVFDFKKACVSKEAFSIHDLNGVAGPRAHDVFDMMKLIACEGCGLFGEGAVKEVAMGGHAG